MFLLAEIEKGLFKVQQNGKFHGIHPETETAKIVNFKEEATAVIMNSLRATHNHDGFMDYRDKQKLDTTVDGLKKIKPIAVKGDNEETYKTGNVHLTKDSIFKPTSVCTLPENTQNHHCIAYYKDGRLNSITSEKQFLQFSQPQMNCSYRGKDITNAYNDHSLFDNIRNGSFKNIYPGDYIRQTVTLNDKITPDCKWVVVDLDYFYGYEGCTTHHIVLMPMDMDFGKERFHSSDDTNGCYKNSEMYQTTLPTKYTAGILNAFGSDHVLTHKEVISYQKDKAFQDSTRQPYQYSILYRLEDTLVNIPTISQMYALYANSIGNMSSYNMIYNTSTPMLNFNGFYIRDNNATLNRFTETYPSETYIPCDYFLSLGKYTEHTINRDIEYYPSENYNNSSRCLGYANKWSSNDLHTECYYETSPIYFDTFALFKQLNRFTMMHNTKGERIRYWTRSFTGQNYIFTLPIGNVIFSKSIKQDTDFQSISPSEYLALLPSQAEASVRPYFCLY